MSRSTRLLGLGAATAVLAPLALVAPAAVAATPADSQPSVSAGDWLAGEVVAGTGDQAGQGFLVSAYNAAPGYDFGIAADAIVSFGDQEAHPEAVTALTAGLEANYEGYVNPALPATEGGTYLNAGSLAKTVLAADVTGVAFDFGGENLVDVLESTLDGNGRAANQGGSQQGVSSVFNQTYAVEALAATGSNGPAASAADALLAAQCADGGFPFTFPTGPNDCFSDVDTTARALIALREAQSSVTNAQEDAEEAIGWLRSQQQADGSFGFSFDGEFTASASSSLLAAQGISAWTNEGGNEPANLAKAKSAARAAGFVRTLQLDSVSGAGSLTGDIGAILSTPGDFTGATEAGELSDFERTGATFAAAQAYGGLEILDGTTKFGDTPSNATFFLEISWLSSRGITTGYAEPNGTTSFRGSQPVLREQMAAFLYRYDNEGTNPPASAPNATFSDSVNNTFSKHIAWLASEGITTGYADNTFRPSAPVLREQMAAFLYRLAGNPSFTAPATSPFTDVPTTATFYKQITWLDSIGITTGYEGPNGTRTFRGSDPVLREQMAAFLYRYYYELQLT